MDDGSCEDMDADACLSRSGIPLGTDSVCTPSLCPQPPAPALDEACCMPDGSCQDADPVACAFASGPPGGPGTTCASVDCLGACFLPNGCCDQKALADCTNAGGNYRAFTVDCSASPRPAGFACLSIVNFPEPSRFMTVQPGCSLDSGELLRDFPGGGDDPALRALFADDIIPDTTWPTHQEAAQACCALLDNFEDQGGSLRATLNGVPYGIEQFFIDECDPLGACCDSDGNCTDASQDDCTALSGTSIGPTTFMGIGSSCSTTTCAPPAPTKWILMETLVNRDNDPLVMT